ncbi:MAG: SGNH/GDSL hydrolase family protein [Arenicella sp.]
MKKVLSEAMKVMLVLLFLAAIFGDFFLVKKLSKMHQVNTELRLNPSQFSPERVGTLKTNILIYGDSLAVQWGELPHLENRKITNYGVKGQTTHQLLLRADKELLGVSADWTILLAGARDLQAAASFPKRLDEIVDQAEENLKALIRKVPSKKVIITTSPPAFSLPIFYKLAGYQSADITAQKKLNDRIRRLASTRVLVLDLYEIFLAQGDIEQFSDNGIHINAKGYGVINQHVTSILLDAE